MKIIEVAREQRDLLNEGIAYIAVWTEMQKNGKRSWFTEDFFEEDCNDADEPIFSEEQLARFAEIVAADENAVLLNGYYSSRIGSADEPLNATQIAEGLKWHYEIHSGLMSGYLADTAEETAEETPETDSAEVTAEEPESPTQCDTGADTDGTITIEIPFENGYNDFTAKRENLVKLLEGKASLIKKALGEDGIGELPIEFADKNVKFRWLKIGTEFAVQTAWTEFLCKAVKFSKKANRVSVKDEPVGDNPKFAMRVLCVKVGLNGSEYKETRKLLLRKLPGSTAFATSESAERWNAKHLKKADTE
jgi:hypothetical protein